MVFIFFKETKVNYDINMKLLVNFIYKKYRKKHNIIIYDKHNKYLRRKDIKYFNDYNSQFIESISNANYIFCSFYQDIIKIIKHLPKNHKCKIINIWHGMPIRNIANLNKHESKECLELISYKDKNIIKHIVTSNFYQSFFCKAFNTGKKNVFPLGNIRESVVLKRKKTAFKYIKKISKGVKFKKIVIYCPTYYSCTKKNIFIYDDYDAKTFNHFLKKNKILFLYKKHDLENREFKCSESNLIEIDNSKLKEFGGGLSTQELFPYVDMLISDISSILIDFLLCDLPIMFCDTTDNFKKEVGLIFEDIFECGYTNKNQKELLNNMMKELNNDSFAKKRRAFCNKTHAYNDGKTMQRLSSLCNLD